MAWLTLQTRETATSDEDELVSDPPNRDLPDALARGASGPRNCPQAPYYCRPGLKENRGASLKSCFVVGETSRFHVLTRFCPHVSPICVFPPQNREPPTRLKTKTSQTR
jgi:hypothetical protein